MSHPLRLGVAAVVLAVGSSLSWSQAPAPIQLKPALDQAAALEHAGEFDAASSFYNQALSMVPGSRHALLGLARVARAQYRFNDARAIYADLLQRDPQDGEATNGMAWIALANHQSDAARSGFNAVLAKEPGNAEALAGIAGIEASRRFQLDVVGGGLRNDSGTAWGGGVSLLAALDATSTLEFTARRNSRELATANPLDSTTLPSSMLRLGYRWQIPGRYGLALAVENRERKNDPTERRLEASAHARVNERLQVFGGVRKGFGTGWDSRVVHAGATFAISGPWEVTTTLFSERRPGFGSSQVFAADLVRQGPGDALLVLGASRGNNPNLTDVHGRAVFPVGKDRAIVVTARHNTFKRESELELGWRQYWK